MANPTISITRTPAGVVAPGTAVVFTVTATDADARSVTYSFTGTDGAGNAQSVTETVVVSDPVTVTATVNDPTGAATLTRDLTDPRVWRSTV